MACQNCAQKTLSLFIRSITAGPPLFTARQTTSSRAQIARSYFTSREQSASRRTTPAHRNVVEVAPEDDSVEINHERPSWRAQKAALKEKLGGEAWNPRKKLSPDTMEGIRHLHQTQPTRFTTPVLADHFKVSPEAIRRILKSKWNPSDEEHDARMQRWDKRGERIWSNMVEMGVKPPKRWRDMGVGRASDGEKPKWKGRRRLIDVKDSARDDFVVEDGDIIPIVDGSGNKKAKSVPLSQRL